MKTVKDLILEKKTESCELQLLENALQLIDAERVRSKEQRYPSAGTVAIACDKILQVNDCWHHGYKLLLFQIRDIMNLPEPRAISDFESKCLYELLIKDNTKQLSHADLAMTEIQLLDIRNALDLFSDMEIKARDVLSNIIQLHLPTPIGGAPVKAYLRAFAIGLNRETLVEGIMHSISEKKAAVDDIIWPEENLTKYEDDWISTFYFQVMRSFGCEFTNDGKRGERAKQEMESIVRLYNSLTEYRILIDIKQEIEKAQYYVKNYADIFKVMSNLL